MDSRIFDSVVVPDGRGDSGLGGDQEQSHHLPKYLPTQEEAEDEKEQEQEDTDPLG